MRDFRRLVVWQRAHALTLVVYRTSARIRPRDFPGLGSQLRRAVSSIPTTLAEGSGHSSRREFARFVQMALASAAEAEYHLQLAHDLGAITPDLSQRLLRDISELRRQLAALLGRARDELEQVGETRQP